MKVEMRTARAAIQQVEQFYRRTRAKREYWESKTRTSKAQLQFYEEWHDERTTLITPARKAVRRCMKVGTLRELQSLHRYLDRLENWVVKMDCYGDKLLQQIRKMRERKGGE